MSFIVLEAILPWELALDDICMMADILSKIPVVHVEVCEVEERLKILREGKYQISAPIVWQFLSVSRYRMFGSYW